MELTGNVNKTIPKVNATRCRRRQIGLTLGACAVPEPKNALLPTEDPPRPLIDQNGNYWLPPTSFQGDTMLAGCVLSAARIDGQWDRTDCNAMVGNDRRV